MHYSLQTVITMLRKALAYHAAQAPYDPDDQLLQAIKTAYDAGRRFDGPQFVPRNLGELLQDIQRLAHWSSHIDVRSAQEKADEWVALSHDPNGTSCSCPTLAVGTVVRAIKKLDEKGAAIEAGTLGFVFGEANCFGDSAGPIVQWITEEGAERVCNVYIGDVDVIRVHNTVQVVHL